MDAIYTGYEDEEDFTIDFDSEEERSPQGAYCEFLTGSAGCGKSYEIMRRLDENSRYALLCATTGISAINLGEGVTTINAALKYFDTESLKDSYVQGHLVRHLKRIRELGYQNIVIDEVSMMGATQLDLIVRAADDLATYKTVSPIGVVVTGDFMQLPPVKERWAFTAKCWPRFAENTVRLTKCWRQDNPTFQEALRAFRVGDGGEGVRLLQECGVQFATNNDLGFKGTTLMSKNDEVTRFNWVSHEGVKGRLTGIESERWGKQKGEWKLIPERLELKIGAYVMILANAKSNAYDSSYQYVNGDCGIVEDFDETDGSYAVRLRRDGRRVKVVTIKRLNEQKERPDREIEAAEKAKSAYVPYYDGERKRWITGAVTYMPMRLAYATTIHKSQGLSLDAVQMNISSAFFGSAGMTYVALSRCRSAEGLRIVGTPELLAKRTCTDPAVKMFL